MPSTEPRNITPHLRRLTVSGQELASLGWLHGTVGRLKKGLGMGFAYQTGEFTMPSGRLDTASLRIEQQWPKELLKLGVAVLVAAVAIITTLALARGGSEPEMSAATQTLPEIPEPTPVLAEDPPSLTPSLIPPSLTAQEAPALVPPKKVKKRKRIKKARRGKKKRRRRR